MFKCGKLWATEPWNLGKNAFFSSCDKFYVILLQSAKLILQLTNSQTTTVLLTSMIPLICAKEVDRHTIWPQAQELHFYAYTTTKVKINLWLLLETYVFAFLQDLTSRWWINNNLNTYVASLQAGMLLFHYFFLFVSCPWMSLLHSL